MHTSLTNLTGKIDFGYRIFEKDEGIALIFFIPKYAIKAASGRKQLVVWYNKMYQFSIKFVILLNK